MTQILTLPNLSSIRNEHPAFYEDMRKLQGFLNTLMGKFGAYSSLVLNGSLTVTGSGGIIDAKIVDNNPRPGEEYFLEYSTSPSFANFQVESLVPSRTRRFSTLAGITTYWRAYKSTKLGGVSNFIVFGGNSPIGVSPGGTAGPAPSSGGSGSGGGGGYGGNPGGGGCVLKGTKIVPLGQCATIAEQENREWITVKLANGMSLTATPDHPIMTEQGKFPLETLSTGIEVITRDGLSRISSLKAFWRKGVKIKVTMPKGHLFWANGILSHNLKTFL